MKCRNAGSKSMLAIIAGFLMLALYGIVGSCDQRKPQQLQAVQKVQALTVKEQKLAEFFIEHRSPHPVELAQVVVKLKRPRLAAAQAVIESNGNKNAIGKAGEKGIWQIIEREHGVVPDDIEGQAQKWEEVFEGYLEESMAD